MKRAAVFELVLPLRDSGKSANRWLYEALRAEILEGRLRPGARLPATRDLARQYGLARGTIVNVLSLAAVASLPLMPAYSVSKAAALSLTQALRALLADRGISVHAVLAGPVDTDMTRDFPIPKSLPAAVARAIFDGVDNNDEELFPDATAAAIADGWNGGASKALEREFAAYLTPVPAAS